MIEEAARTNMWLTRAIFPRLFHLLKNLVCKLPRAALRVPIRYLQARQTEKLVHALTRVASMYFKQRVPLQRGPETGSP